MAIGEVVYKGRGCTCAHDDCMPCRSEMSATWELSTILVKTRDRRQIVPDTLSPSFLGRHGANRGAGQRSEGVGIKAEAFV